MEVAIATQSYPPNGGCEHETRLSAVEVRSGSDTVIRRVGSVQVCPKADMAERRAAPHSVPQPHACEGLSGYRSASSIYEYTPRSAVAAVRPRDHFEGVAVRVAEIDAAPAVVMVDLAGPPTSRISPVSEATILDAAEDGVEFSFTDQESVVLRPDRALGVGKVERDTVVQLNDVEVAEAGRHWPAQHLGKELGGGALVRAPDDGVIELYRHDAGPYRHAGLS